jgi:hypothetical protein
VLVMLSAPGERDQWLPTAMAIVESLTPVPVVTATRIAR